MERRTRKYRILDKDLGRVTNAEHASLASGRHLMRIGLALTLMAAAALFSATVFAGQPMVGVMAATLAVSAYLGLSIGANDVSNSLSPAVGAGAITLPVGLALVAMMEILGAVIAGGPVTRTLTQGLLGDGMGGPGAPTAYIMMAALLAAGSCISVATWLSAPVSTTHSVVGAIAGAALATIGLHAVNWPLMSMIALGWFISPVASGFVAAGLLASMHRRVLDHDDSLQAGRRWLTGLVGLNIGIVALVGGKAYHGLTFAQILALGIMAVALGAAYAHVSLSRQIALGATGPKALKRLLGTPLIIAALILSFGHGANSVANIAAPLTIVMSSLTQSHVPLLPPIMVLLLSGIGIAAGVLLFGGRLVTMVGSDITQLNAPRALCISLATSMTVLGFSSFGLPVSTTHVAVGGVFGVGFYREWRDRQQAKQRPPLPDEEVDRRQLVRRSHVRNILGAWAITVPLNAAVAAALVWVIGV